MMTVSLRYAVGKIVEEHTRILRSNKAELRGGVRIQRRQAEYEAEDGALVASILDEHHTMPLGDVILCGHDLQGHSNEEIDWLMVDENMLTNARS